VATRRQSPPQSGKEAARATVVASLERDLAAMTAAAKSAHEAATHAEAKPENDKDTRGLEAGYLAAGQSARAAELMAALAALKAVVLGPCDKVTIGAIVELEDDDGEAQRLFVLPAGAGVRVDVNGGVAKVVSPQAPLVAPLMGRRAGDEAEVTIGGKRRTVEIVSVG